MRSKVYTQARDTHTHSSLTHKLAEVSCNSSESGGKAGVLL